MSEITIEDHAKILREIASKSPLMSATINIIDDVIPYGLEGMLEIHKDIKDIKDFNGTDDEFTQLLRDKRTAYRKKHNITEATNITENEQQRINQITKLVKEITKGKPVKK